MPFDSKGVCWWFFHFIATNYLHVCRWSFLLKGSNLLYEFSFMPCINSCKIFLKAVEYDKEDSALRIRGKNILENEHVKVLVLQFKP